MRTYEAEWRRGIRGRRRHHSLCATMRFHYYYYSLLTPFTHLNLLIALQDAYGEMGFCPQFDVLWDLLTGEEHLRLFGRIKGLQGEQLDREVERFIREFDLQSHRSKRSETYSGGTKRKLSVALALIGNPRARLLYFFFSLSFLSSSTYDLIRSCSLMSPPPEWIPSCDDNYGTSFYVCERDVQ